MAEDQALVTDWFYGADHDTGGQHRLDVRRPAPPRWRRARFRLDRGAGSITQLLPATPDSGWAGCSPAPGGDHGGLPPRRGATDAAALARGQVPQPAAGGPRPPTVMLPGTMGS